MRCISAHLTTLRALHPQTVQWSETVSSSSLVNEGLFQLPNLTSEGLHFLPAVQRPAIVVPQTLHQALLGLLYLCRHLLHLLALLEFLAQIHDFLADTVVRAVRGLGGGLSVFGCPVVVERGAEVCKEAAWSAGRVLGRVLCGLFGGDRGCELVEFLGLRIADFLEVCVDARLSDQFTLLRTG